MTHRTATLRTILLLALPALVACAPHRPAPGALSPVRDRASNGARAADLAVIDQWEARRVALLRNDGADLPARGVALARAGAWIAFAREAYLYRPRGRDADEALVEAGRLLDALERDDDAPAARGALAAAADRTSPDNWAEVERLAADPDAVRDVASLAEAEIELVRASAPASERLLAPSVVLAGAPTSAVALPATVATTSVSPLSCPAVRHLARAVALLEDADVMLQGEPAGADPVADLQRDPRLRAPRVHFGLKSDAVRMPSAALLAGVAEALREHPELSLVIEGHTDPRGADELNRRLSGRRAAMVRDILADSGVSQDRMLVRLFGERQRAAQGTSAVDYARDRRVQLKFALPDGEELPIAEDAALDLQVEHVVKRAASARRRPAAGRPTGAPR